MLPRTARLGNRKHATTCDFRINQETTFYCPKPKVFSFKYLFRRRGIVVDDCLRVKGTQDVWALGDASATTWAPTAQVASKQGKYLASLFNSQRASLTEAEPFTYEHAGTLAYIGNDEAIADLPGGWRVGGALTYYFWRSAYLSNLFSLRNKVLVMFDWTKKSVFGRDISRE